jgi:hypothetical protein
VNEQAAIFKIINIPGSPPGPLLCYRPGEETRLRIKATTIIFID